MGESEKDLSLSRPQHVWDGPQYLEESWRVEETCCQTPVKQAVTTELKNLHRVK